MKQPIVKYLSIITVFLISATGYTQTISKENRDEALRELSTRPILVDELDNYFYNSLIAYINLDNKNAIKHINKAIGLIKENESKTLEQFREPLKKQIKNLKDLQKKIEDGTATYYDFNSAFLKTHLALTRHHKRRASAFFKQNELIASGYELETSLKHLSHSKRRISNSNNILKLNREERKIVKKMQSGEYVDPKDVERIMKKLEIETEELRKRIE